MILITSSTHVNLLMRWNWHLVDGSLKHFFCCKSPCSLPIFHSSFIAEHGKPYDISLSQQCIGIQLTKKWQKGWSGGGKKIILSRQQRKKLFMKSEQSQKQSASFPTTVSCVITFIVSASLQSHICRGRLLMGSRLPGVRKLYQPRSETPVLWCSSIVYYNVDSIIFPSLFYNCN